MDKAAWGLVVGFLLITGGPLGAAVELSTLVTGLSAPIAFVDPPDSLPHRFIAQQRGDVRVWDGSGATTLPTPFIDLRDDPTVPVEQRKVLFEGERGLLAMAAHPRYAGNGFLFLFYTSRDWDGAGGIAHGDVVIERYTRDAADPDRADPSSGRIILVIARNPDIGNHNGGDLKFGPDGYLYASIGDGGSGCDLAFHSGQDPDQLLGKMLRLDVDGQDAFPADPLRNYAIPSDNPFVGLPGADEIWAMGLRNPFRFSFDRTNGDIYIGDVGQSLWEEIDLLPAGAVAASSPVNFGWPCREGFVASGCPQLPAICSTGTFTDPVRVERNTGGTPRWQAIIGGFRYSGSQVPDLDGLYVYGDAINDEVWAATPSGVQPPPGWPTTQLFTGEGPYAFGEDHFGELYIASAMNSRLDCVQTTGGAACTTWASASDLTVVFADGFESGDLSAWSSSQP